MESTHAWHLHHPALARRLRTPRLGRIFGQPTGKELRQFFQNLDTTIQKIRSVSVSRGRG